MTTEELYKYKGRFFIIEGDKDFEKNTQELSLEEYKSLIEANKIIFEIKYFERKSLELELNYKDYFRTEKKHPEILANCTTDEIIYLLDRTKVDVNRTFINFVTSFKSYVEHIGKRLKKKYGNESPEFKKLNQ